MTTERVVHQLSLQNGKKLRVLMKVVDNQTDVIVAEGSVLSRRCTTITARSLKSDFPQRWTFQRPSPVAPCLASRYYIHGEEDWLLGKSQQLQKPYNLYFILGQNMNSDADA